MRSPRIRKFTMLHARMPAASALSHLSNSSGRALALGFARSARICFSMAADSLELFFPKSELCLSPALSFMLFQKVALQDFLPLRPCSLAISCCIFVIFTLLASSDFFCCSCLSALFQAPASFRHDSPSPEYCLHWTADQKYLLMREESADS